MIVGILIGIGSVLVALGVLAVGVTLYVRTKFYS